MRRLTDQKWMVLINAILNCGSYVKWKYLYILCLAVVNVPLNLTRKLYKICRGLIFHCMFRIGQWPVENYKKYCIVKRGLKT